MPFLVSLAVLLLVASIPASVPSGSAADAIVLTVGGQDVMKTRNLLPPSANDVWTTDVLLRIYDTPIKTDRDGVVRPYLAKGVDFDEDGTFEIAEYGVFAERSGAATPLDIVVYYDLNGVAWHDGTQTTVWDLLFAYHLNAMNARFNTDLRAIFCSPFDSYESCGRQLGIEVLPSRNWEGEGAMAGDASLRSAVSFHLVEPFALFYQRTLSPLLFPLHLWQRTGGGRHADFGCAIWLPPAEAANRGVPECGNADPTNWGRGVDANEPVPGSKPFYYPGAESWVMRDEDVIGSGPFRSLVWVPGSSASVQRYDDYYVGQPSDSRIATFLHLPRISEIRFVAYKTTQLGIFALQSGEIDFYHGNIGADFVAEVIPNPDIAIEANAELGFFYMAYNFRREPWGYAGGNTSNDMGYWFRQAVSHLVDKKSIVQNLLQNYGVVGHGVVSPANTFWYNDNIPKPSYDLAQARAILDDLATPGGIYVPGYTLDPGSTTDCHWDNPAGCRSLPSIGNQLFEIKMPQVDYDPVRAVSGLMIADAMRKVGLNAKTGPPPSYSRDYDMYILGWRIGGTDPDYLFSFFHSLNAPGGQNYPGVQNGTLDAVLDASRREMDLNARQSYIHEAQLLLADIRPYEVLYYRTNIEAYRQDRFVNWTVVAGTIWNEWSLFGIRPPGAAGLQLGLAAPMSLRAGSTDAVSFTVRDLAGEPVVGATVDVHVETPTGEDPGELRSGTQQGPSISLSTNAGGQALAAYAAPVFHEGTRSVVLHAVAIHPGFEPPVAEETILTIVGIDRLSLSLRLQLPVGDVASKGASLPLAIEVRDETGAMVPDAFVAVQSVPAAEVTPPNGTAQDMATVTMTFLANGTHRLTVTASKVGYEDAAAFVDVWVEEPTAPPPPVQPPEKRFDPTAIVFVAAGFAAVGTVGLFVFWRRSRRGSERK